jgi:mRNA interferase RelE/StbE
MTYELLFHPDALDEWGKLDKPVREQFKKKLAERLLNPHVPSAKLSGQKSRYKIKLRSMGYRLVYDAVDAQLIVTVAVGKRERNAVYKAAAAR